MLRPKARAFTRNISVLRLALKVACNLVWRAVVNVAPETVARFRPISSGRDCSGLSLFYYVGYLAAKDQLA